jgi:hypothetical protein
MKETVLIHCQAEYVENWWMKDKLFGICGAPVVRVGSATAGEAEWHLAGYPADFMSCLSDPSYMDHYWAIMADRGFDFERYDMRLCEDCLAHEDLPLLVLAMVGDIDV